MRKPEFKTGDCGACGRHAPRWPFNGKRLCAKCWREALAGEETNVPVTEATLWQEIDRAMRKYEPDMQFSRRGQR